VRGADGSQSVIIGCLVCHSGLSRVKAFAAQTDIALGVNQGLRGTVVFFQGIEPEKIPRAIVDRAKRLMASVTFDLARLAIVQFFLRGKELSSSWFEPTINGTLL